jgi:hypothetical protein
MFGFKKVQSTDVTLPIQHQDINSTLNKEIDLKKQRPKTVLAPTNKENS